MSERKVADDPLPKDPYHVEGQCPGSQDGQEAQQPTGETASLRVQRLVDPGSLLTGDDTDERWKKAAAKEKQMQ
jgi:hypothetical protein